MEYFSIVPRVEGFTMIKPCFAYVFWAVPLQWSGQWFHHFFMAQTITIIMTVGTVALLIYFACVGYVFYYMIRKDFFDHD